MPLQATSGAASYDGFGGGVAAVPTYIEEVFSTYLFTGNGTTQTVTNGIDLIGKGGMVWRKQRDATANHFLADTVRGTYSTLSSNTTAAASGASYIDFLSDGFQAVNSNSSNPSGALQASWTFREQPKFFDVVAYTGNGVSGRLISHNLGSTPGFVVVKNITNAQSWFCWHRSVPNSGGFLETTDAFSPGLKYICGTVNDTVFSVDSAGASVNGTGNTYVAYLFAHDAGGFGLAGTDNVISCGSVTLNGSGNATVNLGYEPQWVMIKRSDNTSTWYMHDTMRGLDLTTYTRLYANTSAAEDKSTPTYIAPSSTGFNLINGFSSASSTWIYVAIRRGPMKTPTVGTSVFSPFTTAAATGTAVTTNFPVDFQLYKYRAGEDYWFDVDRLRGVNSTTTANSTPWLDTTSTAAEATATNVSRNWGNTGFEVPGIVGGGSNVFYSFQRAPGFFDEVCWTTAGTSTNERVSHNLTTVPELIIMKTRSGTGSWFVYTATQGISKYGLLQSTSAFSSLTNAWGTSNPTSTDFGIDASNLVGTSRTMVAYLFATCAGVSKVGSYTGTGSTQTINCGFTGGARFVLIKKTSGTGSWYIWDSARGIVSGNDPYLLLNSTAAEVTNTDYIDTYSAGFEISSTAPSEINENGGSFIFLAIS